MDQTSDFKKGKMKSYMGANVIDGLKEGLPQKPLDGATDLQSHKRS